MNTTLKQLQNRRSVRNFTGEKIKEGDLEIILKAAQRAPSSINAQQISLIVTEDKNILSEVAKFSGNQKQIETAEAFVLIVMDFNRVVHGLKEKNLEFKYDTNIESIVTGSIDAGIILSAIQTSAESLGYGTTAIGALRQNPDEFIKLFNLPKFTYPILGTTIGVPTKESLEAPLKPRFNFDTFLFKDKYDDEKIKNSFSSYDEALNKWRDIVGLKHTTYAETVSRVYSSTKEDFTRKILEEQGFVLK